MKPVRGTLDVDLPDVVSPATLPLKGKQYWSRTERTKWLVSLMCASGLVDMTRVCMSLSVVAIAHELEWDKLETGLVLSSFFWGYFVTQLPGGILSDRYGGDQVITWAIFGCAVTTLGIPMVTQTTPSLYFAPPLLLVVMLRVCLGFSQGLYFPSVGSLLGKQLPLNERSFGNSITCAGGPIGALLIGSLGSILLTTLGWRWVFLSIGFLAVIWVVIWREFFLRKRTPLTELYMSKKFESREARAHNRPAHTLVPWGKLIRKPAVWAIIVVHFCHNCMYLNLSSWLPTYFHENYPDAKGWIFNVVPYVGNLVGKVIGGYLADKMIRLDCSVTFVRKLFETTGTGGAALVILLAVNVTEFWQALACMTLAFSLSGLTTSGSMCNIQDLSPTFAGSISGIVYTITSIPGILGVYLTGYLLHATGSWVVVFQLTAAICLFGSLFYIIFGTSRRIA